MEDNSVMIRLYTKELMETKVKYEFLVEWLKEKCYMNKNREIYKVLKALGEIEE